MIELDVQLTRDDELVVLHDLELGRTAHAEGRVRDHELARLKQFDFGRWFGERFAGAEVLTLAEVLSLVGGRARLNVEIKAPADDWPVLAPRLVEILRRFGADRSALVSCFDPGALASVRRVCSQIPLGVLWHSPEISDAWPIAQDLKATAFHPHWFLVSSEVVGEAHSRGLKVLAWTVNEIDEMRRLVALGVDGVISDHPERFPEVDLR